MTQNKGGRPPKIIDKKQFENLCGLQCTEEEICGFFDISDKTLTKFCKETYGAGFSEVFAQKRGLGKISLRRNMFRLAEKNAAMAIFLAKNHLGMSDDVNANLSFGKREDDPLSAAMKKLAEDLKNDE